MPRLSPSYCKTIFFAGVYCHQTSSDR